MRLEFIRGGLSGKGLARCTVARPVSSPIPIRTAREVFRQASQPVRFVQRVMRPVGRRPLSFHPLNAGQRLDLPAPIKSQDVVEVFVTPSPPTATRLSPTFPPRQPSADGHLDVVADLAKGGTCVVNLEVVEPPGQRGVDPLHQFRRRGCSACSAKLLTIASQLLRGFSLPGGTCANPVEI